MELEMTQWQKQLFDQWTSKYGEVENVDVTPYRGDEELNLIILEFVGCSHTTFSLGLCEFKCITDLFCELSLHSADLDFDRRAEYLLGLANFIIHKRISFWEKHHLGFKGSPEYRGKEAHRDFASLILLPDGENYQIEYTSPPFRQKDAGLRETCKVYEVVMLYDVEYNLLIGRRDLRADLASLSTILKNVLTRGPLMV